MKIKNSKHSSISTTDMNLQPQQYCLRWKYHHSNLQTMFSQLLDRGCFCDVTLACEGQTIKAHRVVLCACSTYFDAILTNCCSEKDPIIIMRDAKFTDIKCLIEFMYKGEINVEHGSLASLLKTAEELKIKGLAEVSWREEDIQHSNFSEENITDLKSRPTSPCEVSSHGNDTRNVSSIAPLNPVQNKELNLSMPIKKKRGRPPLDGEFETYNKPKHPCVEVDHSIIESANLVSVMMNENSQDNHQLLPKSHKQPADMDHCVSWAEQNLDSKMECDEDEPSPIVIPKLERPETPHDDMPHPDDMSSPNSPLGATSMQPVFLSKQELEEWQDVIKMNDYLTKGRRPHFWEEPFCKRVMDAIKNKDLEMKKAAQILGVSYGTLYGRYRETYGCLKHPYRGPFMVSRLRDIWADQTPTEIIHLLQKGVITLPRAAELMNTTSPMSHDWLSFVDPDKEDLELKDHAELKDLPLALMHSAKLTKSAKLTSHKMDATDYCRNAESEQIPPQENNNRADLILPNHPEVSVINVSQKSTSIGNRGSSSIVTAFDDSLKAT